MITLEYTDIFDNNKIKKLQFSKHLIKTPFNKKSLFAVIVDGKSMEPVISHQALIIADLSKKELEDEKIYLVYFDNKMWVKRYKIEDKTFISINPKFTHLIYKQKDVHLVAKVLLTFTNL
jgi:phage repressor protein C with HTH and peptisase S24 domain